MRKDQCVELVKFASLAWFKSVSEADLLDRTKAFWEIIQDLDYGEARQAVVDMMTAMRRWMPTPAELRLQVVGSRLPGGFPPTGIEAWGDLQRRAANAYSGTTNKTPPHPVLGHVMQKFGPSVMGLSTNADREIFLSEYRDSLGRFMNKHAPVVPQED